MTTKLMNIAYRNDPQGGFYKAPTHRSVRETIFTLPERILDELMIWQKRIRERRHLVELDDRLLKDIGLSRADVDKEYAKPFWRA